MSDAVASTPLALLDPVLQNEVEQFLYYEAGLLDDRQIETWVALMSDDVRYVMPMRSNRIDKDIAQEWYGDGDLAYFDESKTSLLFRLRKLNSGMAWAENPPSRTRRLISNVRIRAGASAGELQVSSSFVLYRTRLERQVDVFVGARHDLLRRVDSPARFQIAHRRILLDQATLLAPNLSVFI